MAIDKEKLIKDIMREAKADGEPVTLKEATEMAEMEIKDLINKKGKFSKAEIDYLIAEGAKVGVMPPKNRKCSNCWRI